MSWTNDYVGIPYEINGREMDALDCWGLVRQVYKRELGFELPSYADYEHSLDSKAFTAAFEQEREMWKTVAVPEEYDVAWCRIVGVECHCGVMLANGRMMLHAMEGQDICIVSTMTPVWQRRILRCYRLQ